MSEEGTNLSEGTREIHDRTFITTSTMVGLTKMDNSDSSKSDKDNTSSKPASPVVSGDVVEIKGTWRNVVATEEEGEGDGDGIASDASESKSKSSSGEGDCELLDLVAGASEGGSRGNGNKDVKNSTDVDHMMHVLIEKERRKEINNKFDLLHALVPNLPEKTDKATIVEATINYIKNLQDEIQKLEMLKAERERAAAAVTVTVDATLHAPPPPPPPLSEEEQEPVAVAVTREMTLADLVHIWEQEAAAGGRGSGGRGPPATAPAAPLQTWTGPNMTASLTGHDAFITLSLPHHGQNIVAGAVCVLDRHHIDVVTVTISTSEQGSSLISLHCHLSPESSSSQNLTPLNKYKLAVSELMLWVISI